MSSPSLHINYIIILSSPLPLLLSVSCMYLHGAVCELCGRQCLHPFDEEQRKSESFIHCLLPWYTTKAHGMLREAFVHTPFSFS